MRVILIRSVFSFVVVSLIATAFSPLAYAKTKDIVLGPKDLSCQALLEILNGSPASGSAEWKPDRISKKKSTKSIQSATLRQMRPLQGLLGFSRVALTLRDWIDNARLIAFNFESDERSFIIERIQAEASRGIDVLIDPDGQVRPKDGHHKIKAIQTLMEIYKIPVESVAFTIKVSKEDDFRDRTWSEFAEHVKQQGLSTLSPAEIQQLPKDFSGFQDSPLRSTTGQLFEIVGLSGVHFSPMAQFLFGRALAERGLTVESGQEFSGAVIGRGLALMFDESLGQSSAIRSLLLKMVDPKFVTVVQQALAEAQTRYLSVRRSVEADTRFEDVDFFDSSDFEPNGEALDVVSYEARTGEILFNMTLSFPNVLPDSIALPRDQGVYRRLFAAVLALKPPAEWKNTLAILNSLKSGEFLKNPRAEKKILKELRKYTLLVRSAYRFLSEDNLAPKNLEDFSTQLGELNDLIAKWSQKRVKKATVAEAASRLLKLLKNDSSLFNPPFNADLVQDEHQTFINYQKRLIDKMQNIFDEKRQLTVDNYHWLRRRVRDFANLLKILQLEQHDISIDLLSRMLSNLSRRMGAVKDGMIHSEYADNIKNPGQQITQLDPVSDRMLAQFFLIMGRSLNMP